MKQGKFKSTLLAISVLATGTPAQQPPPNVLEWDHAAMLIRRAKELITEHGWQQGSEVPTSHECLTTSIERAFYERKGCNYTIVDFNYACHAVSDVLGVERYVPKRGGDPLDLPYWGRSFMEYNDKSGRTAEEVIGALDKAFARAVHFKARAINRAARRKGKSQ